MPKGGNGGGGGKPGGDPGGDGTVQWRGSRGNDLIFIVDDGEADREDEFTISEFLAGSFDGRRGRDTLNFSALISEGISLNLSSGEVSFDQSYLGFLLDFFEPDSTFTSVDLVSFENVVGTSGDDSFRGFVSYAVVDGGAGDDLLDVRGTDTILIGGEGSDDFIGGGMIYVGGDWDGTYDRQAGDGTTDNFFSYSVILDFELPDGEGGGDRLFVDGLIGSDNADALETFFSYSFYDGTWIDPDGNSHDAAIYPTVDGTGAYFTLVGITAAEANSQVLPNIATRIGTTEAGFLLSGTANDDWFELVGDANQVLFEMDGGNDTLLYGRDADPMDDTLFFEGDVPTIWTHSNADGVDVWTAEYYGDTISIVGLDQSGFDALTMATAPIV